MEYVKFRIWVINVDGTIDMDGDDLGYLGLKYLPLIQQS
jgi:hypothetical protein